MQSEPHLPPLDRLRLLAWAIERSDDLRNAYAQRGSIILAASGFVVAGLAVLARPELFKLLQKSHWATVLWFSVLFLAVMWCTGRAVWHVLRSTVSTFESNRDRIQYEGAKRAWLNPDDTLGTGTEKEPGLRQALFWGGQERSLRPDNPSLASIQNVDLDALIDGWSGELWFVLCVQNRRYQRLGWSVTALSVGFALYLFLLISTAVLYMRLAA